MRAIFSGLADAPSATLSRSAADCTAKRRVGHGKFLCWLGAEFGWSDKTAERFMSVDALAGKIDNLSDLELPISALYLLAAPCTASGRALRSHSGVGVADQAIAI
jgi:hypothetical protein